MVGQVAPENLQPYSEAKKQGQGVTPANPSDDSTPFGQGASSAEAMGGSQVVGTEEAQSWRGCICKRTSVQPDQRGAPIVVLRNREVVLLLCRKPAAHLPLHLVHSWQICARSFPACHPGVSSHTQEQCAWKV